MNEQKQRKLVAAEEERAINREVMVWINTFPDLPDTISIINYGVYQTNAAGKPVSPNMRLMLTQGTYIVSRDILGNHTAEYQFVICYRGDFGNSSDARLKIDELLNSIGDWATQNWPNLGDSIRVQKLEIAARAAYAGVYEDNGDEEHQILMRLIYEVI